MLYVAPFVAWVVAIFLATATVTRLYSLHNESYTNADSWLWALHVVSCATSLLLSVAVALWHDHVVAWLSAVFALASVVFGFLWHAYNPVNHSLLFQNPSPTPSDDEYDGAVDLQTLEPRGLTEDEYAANTAPVTP